MSQGALQIGTTGPRSPAQFATDINTAVAGVVSKNSGGSQAANFNAAATQYMDWINSTTASANQWNIYDGTNFILVGTLDITNHVWKPYFGLGDTLALQSIAASQNNYNPSGLSVANRIPITASVAALQITGLAGGLDGRTVTFDVQDGSNTIQFVANSGSSSAGNRFDMPVNVNVAAGHSVTFFWSTQTANWRVLGGLPMSGPTQQKFTSGTAATYTTPAGCVRIRVRMVGGGASGAQNSAGSTDGTAGNASSFGGVTANGGTQGLHTPGATQGGLGGTGGAGSLGTFTNRFPGDQGAQPDACTGNTFTVGGDGGTSPFGGAGKGANTGTNAANSAVTNTGSGGAGQATQTTGQTGGGGGGSGEYVEFDVPNPAATYTYTVGAIATAPAGAGNGATGLILVEEFYN